MKVVFMGTPEFAYKSLEALDAAGIEIVCVVTQPDRPQGRCNLMIPSHVKMYAIERGFRIFQPNRAEQITPDLEALAPDFIAVVAFGQILKRAVLDVPAKATINVHGSLLPKYRGAAPINRAVINGEKETGVTTMLLDEGMDTGDMLLAERVSIGAEETAGELYDRLAVAGARLLVKTLFEFDRITPVRQNESEATYAQKLMKADGRIDWTAATGRIRDLVRGCNPWPSAFTFHKGEMLKVWRAKEAAAVAGEGAAPGTVLEAGDAGIVVATGSGSVAITEIQREGKKRQPVGDFIRGYKISVGDVLNTDG